MGLGSRYILKMQKELVSILLLIALFTGFISLLPGAAAPAASSEVSLQLSPDGGLEVTAPAYHARIGSDGNLHSLRVGDTEMLDDRASFSLGAFFYAENPIRLGTVTLPAPTKVKATDGVHTAEYTFLPGEIRLSISHTSDKELTFYLVLSEEVTTATNTRSAEVAALPAEAPWPDVTFTARSGAYITLRGGDRIWGPWADREIWELGPLAAGRPREVAISPGMGAPPKPTAAQLFSLQVETADKDRILSAGRQAALLVNVDNRGAALPEGSLTLRIKNWRGKIASEVSQELDVGEKSQAQSRFDLSLLDPGIYSAEVVFSAGNRPLKETLVTLAFRPEEIRPTISIPADFEAYWAAALTEARPATGEDVPEFIEDQSLSSKEITVYRVSFTGAKGKKLNGWLCVPARPGPHPGILQLGGYGHPKVEPPMILAGRGYAALAAEVVAADTDNAYIARNIEDAASYAYREIVINALRALDLLVGRTDVDPQRVAVSGASQGGGLAVLLAALHPEIAAVAADMPMLCDFPRAIRESGWPYTEIARYLQTHQGAEARVLRTLSYFDMVNAAPRVQSPALISLGLRDTICRPETIFAAYNCLPGRKEIKVYPEAGHEGGGSAHWIYKLQWLDAILQPATAPPSPEEKNLEKPSEPTAPPAQ